MGNESVGELYEFLFRVWTDEDLWLETDDDTELGQRATLHGLTYFDDYDPIVYLTDKGKQVMKQCLEAAVQALAPFAIKTIERAKQDELHDEPPTY